MNTLKVNIEIWYFKDKHTTTTAIINLYVTTVINTIARH